MKIDQDYTKHLLNIFIESECAGIYPDSFVDNGIPLDAKFLFHMQILEDQHFVECLDKIRGLGYEIGMGGEFTWKGHPIRLTAAGHEFAEALNKSEVWDVLKKEFKEASLSTLSNAAKQLLGAFARKQINKYFEL